MNAKLIIIALIGAFMFTSCEKEEANPVYVTKNEKMGAKLDNVSINKSSLESQVSTFINDITEGNDPGDFEAVQALLFLESAMNFEYNNIIGNDEEFPIIQDSYRVEELDVSAFQVDELVDGSDILALKSEIFEAIDQVAVVAADTIPGEGELYVTGIDIEFNEDDISSGVHLNFSLGRFALLGGGCNGFDGDYFLLDDMGGCNTYGNAGTLTNVDANDMVSAYISNRYCNTNIAYCTAGGPPNVPTWFAVNQVYSPIGNTNNIYYSTTSPVECVPEATQLSIASSIMSWQSSLWPSSSRFGTVEVKNCFTRNWSNTTSGVNFTINQVTQVGVCLIIEAELKPRVSWGSL